MKTLDNAAIDRRNATTSLVVGAFSDECVKLARQDSNRRHNRTRIKPGEHMKFTTYLTAIGFKNFVRDAEPEHVLEVWDELTYREPTPAKKPAKSASDEIKHAGDCMCKDCRCLERL
jgi:hypothetical protein